MSMQAIGEKKTRAASARTGLVIDRAWRRDNHSWEARVPVEGGHIHVRIDTDTWEHEPSTGPCFNTCVTTRVGPVDAYAWARP